jgi:L-cysteine S-thiosulfotransferase
VTARCICLILIAALSSPPGAARGDDRPAPRSGLEFVAPGIRQLQDDEFANPGMLWVLRGQTMWRERQGARNKSCADCHGADGPENAAAAARYPRFDSARARPLTLEQRINLCRTEHMGALPVAHESEALLALTAFVRRAALGEMVSADTSEGMAAIVARGRQVFEQRRGAFDLACRHCHELNVGKRLREEQISEGQSNGFPAYRVSWQTLVSLHRRFQACDMAVGAEPLPLGHDDYVALEAYLARRGKGLLIETPAVRR